MTRICSPAFFAFFFFTWISATVSAVAQNSPAETSLEPGTKTIFQSYFELELEGSASYYMFTLTPEAYMASMSIAGRDLRVIDADGNPVPYAFGGSIETVEEPSKKPFLQSSPWLPLPPARDGGNVQDGFIMQGEIRQWREKLPGRMQPEGDVFFDTAGVYPVDRLRFHLPRINTVAQVKLYSRADENAQWRMIHQETLYRLQGRDGTEQESPEIQITPNRDRFWKMETGGAGMENYELGGTPLLDVGWRPEAITFLARGTPPFLLAIGSANATDAGIPLERLLAGDELYLVKAQIGAARSTNIPTVSLGAETVPLENQTRRYVLWGVLLTVVALLAFMAWKAARHLPQVETGEKD